MQIVGDMEVDEEEKIHSLVYTSVLTQEETATSITVEL